MFPRKSKEISVAPTPDVQRIFVRVADTPSGELSECSEAWLVVLGPADGISAGGLVDAATEPVAGSSFVFDEQQRRFSWGADLPWEQMLVLTVGGRIIGTAVVEAIKGLCRKGKSDSATAGAAQPGGWDVAAHTGATSAQEAWSQFDSFLERAFGLESAFLVEIRATEEGWTIRAQDNRQQTFTGRVTADGRLVEARRDDSTADTADTGARTKE